MQYLYKSWGLSIEPTDFAKQNLFYSDCVGRIVHYPETYINRSRYDYYYITNVLEGKYIVEQYGKKFIVNKGESILLSMYDPHIFYVDKSIDCVHQFFHFNSKNIDSFISLITEHVQLPYIYKSDKIAEIFLKIEYTYGLSSASYYEPRMSAYIYEALCDILTCLNNTKVDSKLKYKIDFLDTVDKYINDNINSHISLDLLSSLVSLSKYHFLRVFEEYSGLTPKQYILKKKIDKAKYYLIYTDKKISEIAEFLDFSDQNHFIKIFKKIEHCTPIQYININKSAALKII